MLRLACPTDARYAEIALGDVPSLLVDHAHCEHKAAVTALSFVSKYPDDPVLVQSLATLARDEAGHFARMVEVCTSRGLSLGHPGEDRYVAALLDGVRKRGSVLEQRVDRLLVCAFIEARAGERLEILAAAFTAANERELAPLYGALWREEARHHALFVDLAARSLARAGVDVRELGARLQALSLHEGEIVRALPVRAAIH